MNYNFFGNTAQAMPRPGKGTECIKLLLSQASKDMREPLVPMLFPILGAHISGSEFQHPNLIWEVYCDQRTIPVAESGGNEGQLSQLLRPIVTN